MKFDIFSYPRTLLIFGPSGTGKTTFMASYVEAHHKKFGNNCYWLAKKSIVPTLNELLPKYIIATPNLLDERFAGIRKKGERTCVIADEMNRLLSKYDHAKEVGKAFGDFVGLHRHKDVDLLMSDQAFDFLYAARVRAHTIIITGMSEMLFNILKQHLTGQLLEWLLNNKSRLISLGEENRKTIREKNYGRVVLTNGSFTTIIKFQKPEWYTKDFSHIWRNISAEDLLKEYKVENDLPDFDPDDDIIQAMYLAIHLAKAKFGKVTKEKFAGMFPLATKIITGRAKMLTDSGRGKFELAMSTHKMFCSWCKNSQKTKEAIKIAKELAKDVTEERGQKIEKELASIL